MSVDWYEIQRALQPIKDFEDLERRWQVSFGYPFVHEAYHFNMPELAEYTRRLLGGDSRGRYTKYCSWLTSTMMDLHQAGVGDLTDLMKHAGRRKLLENFSNQSGLEATDIAAVFKYLIYWVVPMEKLLNGLLRPDQGMTEEVDVLRKLGVRTNLDMLQQGLTRAGRLILANESGLSEAVIMDWVNRADLSRLPWASKATISNIMGSGYGSLVKLANADPERLYADFFSFGKAIGKNLKFGNEIESSQRIARILPTVIQE